MRKISPQAQVLIEYVTIAVLVMCGILIAGPYVVRSINAFFKASSSQVKDSMNEQMNQGPLVPNPPTCRPVCRSRRCGDDDGCGGICTDCPDPQVCNTWVAPPTRPFCCDPYCPTRYCGNNACGDPCPACGPGDVCNASTGFFCCTPDCNNKTCGDNGCNQPCGACGGGDVCTTIGCTPPLLDCCCHVDCSFQPGYCGEICGGVVCPCTNPGEICGPGFACTTCGNGTCDPGETCASCPADHICCLCGQRNIFGGAFNGNEQIDEFNAIVTMAQGCGIYSSGAVQYCSGRNSAIWICLASPAYFQFRGTNMGACVRIVHWQDGFSVCGYPSNTPCFSQGRENHLLDLWLR